MPASITRSNREGLSELAGVTSGKAYPVQGYTGGGVVIVTDEGKFHHVGFARIAADWTVTVDGAEKDKPKPKPAAEAGSGSGSAGTGSNAAETETKATT